mgnify:FL=1
MRVEQPFAENGRPIPRRTPTSAPYFDAAREGKLRLQECPRDGFFFYPRSRCPNCLSDDWSWKDVSGRAEIYSYTIDRIGLDPAQRPRVPYVVAIVELEEGPRLTTNIVDCEAGAVFVGMPVHATFEDLGRETLIHFKPSA